MIHAEILLENQLNAMENNQCDFILYYPGSGGEFISGLIAKYSKRNYFNIMKKPEWYFIGHNNKVNHKLIFANRYFVNNMPYVNDKSTKNGCDEYKQNSLYIKLNLELHLALDQWLNNDGKFLVRSHFLKPEYMNPNNTYVIFPDTKYWKKYNQSQVIAKIGNENAERISWNMDEICNNTSEFKKIYMSKFLKKEYLEQMFDIQAGM